MFASTFSALAAAALTGGALLGTSAPEPADQAPSPGASVSETKRQNVCPGERGHPEMERMHEQMMNENPGMARMHDQMMGESSEEDMQ